MDSLPQLIEFLVHLDFGLADGFLRAIDGVSEQATRLVDALNIGSILQFNALGGQEAAEVSEQFAFLDGFHISVMTSLSRRIVATITEPS